MAPRFILRVRSRLSVLVSLNKARLPAAVSLCCLKQRRTLTPVAANLAAADEMTALFLTPASLLPTTKAKKCAASQNAKIRVVQGGDSLKLFTFCDGYAIQAPAVLDLASVSSADARSLSPYRSVV